MSSIAVVEKQYSHVPFNLMKPSFHGAPVQNFTFLFEWKESVTEYGRQIQNQDNMRRLYNNIRVVSQKRKEISFPMC